MQNNNKIVWKFYEMWHILVEERDHQDILILIFALSSKNGTKSFISYIIIELDLFFIRL